MAYIERPEGRKYTKSDIRADPKLVTLAIQYVRNSLSEFMPIRQARQKLDYGRPLTVLDVQKVLNTMRHDDDVELPEPLGSRSRDTRLDRGDDIAYVRKPVVKLTSKPSKPFVITDAVNAETIHLIDVDKFKTVYYPLRDVFEVDWKSVCKPRYQFPNWVVPTGGARMLRYVVGLGRDSSDLEDNAPDDATYYYQYYADLARESKPPWSVPSVEFISLYDAEKLIDEHGWRFCRQCRTSGRMKRVWDEIYREPSIS